MDMVDIKQRELDIIEQQVLLDLFGGYSNDKFVFKLGLFKIDLTQKVQKIIDKFEEFIKPVINNEGFIQTDTIQRYLNDDYIKLPQGNYRLIDLYREYRPYFIKMLSFIKEI